MPKSAQKEALGVKERWAIVLVYGMTKSIAATVRECKCSKKAVARWVKRFAASGDVLTLPRRGRTPVLTPKLAQKALKLLKSGLFSGAKQVVMHLMAKGDLENHVSKSTLIRHVRAEVKKDNHRLVVKHGKPKKGITLATRQKRLFFTKMNQSRD